jgi:hypothetical protein
MQDWINLRSIQGDLMNGLLWAKAISLLPNLKEIKWDSTEIYEDNIVTFCNICQGKVLCETLEELSTSADQHHRNEQHDGHNDRITDDSLFSILDTFTNLTAIKFHLTNVTLTRVDLKPKLKNVNKLKTLCFGRSHLFFDGITLQ